MSFEVKITNTSTLKKIVNYTGMASSTKSIAYISGAGTWNNQTSQINKIDLFCVSPGGVNSNLPVGTRMTIYGGKD